MLPRRRRARLLRLRGGGEAAGALARSNAAVMHATVSFRAGHMLSSSVVPACHEHGGPPWRQRGVIGWRRRSGPGEDRPRGFRMRVLGRAREYEGRVTIIVCAASRLPGVRKRVLLIHPAGGIRNSANASPCGIVSAAAGRPRKRSSWLPRYGGMNDSGANVST